MRRNEMRRSGWGVRLAMLVVTLAAGLSACGGGGGGGGSGSGDSAASAPLTIGPSGGTVSDASGVTVVVPAEALSTETSIRVAMDSSGAPVLPQAIAAGGSIYAITPHGASFAQAVRVSIPAPSITLQPGERLVIAKAQPGGQWELLGDTESIGNTLQARVTSFSYFVAAILRIRLEVPLEIHASLSCGDQPCDAAYGSTTATFAVTTNGAPPPAECNRSYTLTATSFLAGVAGQAQSDFVTVQIPLSGGVLQRTVMESNEQDLGGPASNSYYEFKLSVRCEYADSLGQVGGHVYTVDAKELRWARYPANHQLALVAPRQQVQRDVAIGESVNLESVWMGGAVNASYQWLTSPPAASGPTADDHAIVEWQRSIDNGASWQSVWVSFQDRANPRPHNSVYPWRAWSVGYGFVVSAADAGALVRSVACYRAPTSFPQPPCVTSPATRLNLLQSAVLPSFTAQARSMLIRTGQTASLSVAVSGLPAPTLSWQTRVANSQGAWADVGSEGVASGSTYTTRVLLAADNGRQYRAVATNAAGSVAGLPVTVSVSDVEVPPTIGAQPASLSVVRGSEALFAVNATGTEALSYQWFKGGVVITGANAPQLKIGNVADADAGSYSVEVSNTAGRVSSASAQLTVTSAVPAVLAPAIATQPAAVTVTAGNVATFAVGVTGSGPMSFQWRKNGVDIAGASAAALTLPAVAIADAGNYSVRVSNSAGSVVSQTATLAVAPAGTAVQPVTIATQPGSVVVAPGMAANLAVTVSGSGPLSYEWFRNGVAVPGQTSAVYAISAASALDAGTYFVQVSNSAGTVSSAAGQVMLLGAPAVTVPPAAQSVTEGSTASFSVTATGNALRYQWLRNGGAIAGADSASYTTPALALADSGAVYSVIVYNGAGLVFSSSAVLTVTSSGSPTPAGMAIYAGDLSAGGGGNSADGIGTGARFDYPEGLTADSAGNLYVPSSNGSRVSKVDANTVVTTLARHAGTSQLGLSRATGDLYSAATSYCGLARVASPLSAGTLITPVDVTGCPGSETRGAAVDSNGVLYLALRDAHSIVRLTPAALPDTMTATLFAGAANTTNGAGSQDGIGGTARFNAPRGIAFGPDGNLYVADTGNHTIRRITPQGAVSTFVGQAGQAGSVDGSASAARLDSPIAIAFDPAGNLVVLDRGPESAVHARVRRVTPAGAVATLFDAHAEALALAQPGQEPFATNIKGLAVLDSRRIALSAGNAILVRTLP